MRTLIFLLILLLITAFIPSPVFKQTTTCINETECTSESSFGWGPSLFQMVKNRFSSTKAATTP